MRRVSIWASVRSTAARNTPRCCCVFTCSPEKISTAGFGSNASRRSSADAVSEGRRVFETTACINCHSVAGTMATGRFGPDLTHLMSRETIAAGAALNTPENLRLWIRNPEAIKPGSLMPAMELNDQDSRRTNSLFGDASLKRPIEHAEEIARCRLIPLHCRGRK